MTATHESLAPAELSESAQKNLEFLRLSGEVGNAIIPAYLEAIQLTAGLTEDAVIANLPGPTSSIGSYEAHTVKMRLDQGWQPYDSFVKQFSYSSEYFTHLLGRPLSAVTFARFVLAHELGHYLDDIQPSQAIPFSYRRKKEMSTLPIPGHAPSQVSEFLQTRQGRKYLSKEDFGTQEDVAHIQEVKYRKLPTEQSADQFAVRVLKATFSE